MSESFGVFPLRKTGSKPLDSDFGWPQGAPPKAEHPPKILPTGSNLVPCPDCAHGCSLNAEACPACGRFFRSYMRQFAVTPGAGWVNKIAWSIVVSAFLWGAIMAGLFTVFLVLIAGAGSGQFRKI